jgi:protein-S-isoprenylcysteine O-methyltransferase
MNLTVASVMGIIYGVSEILLSIKRRAKRGETKAADQGSLGLIWAVIGVSCYVAFSLPYMAPGANLGSAAALPDLVVGCILFFIGLSLRWYAIIHLGRFFTVNVAIAQDHRVVDTGPYHYIRHPSYTGAITAFLGLGLVLNNWASLLVLAVFSFAVFARRIAVEEAALTAGLGEAYRQYMQRTRRLIPGIY